MMSFRYGADSYEHQVISRWLFHGWSTFNWCFETGSVTVQCLFSVCRRICRVFGFVRQRQKRVEAVTKLRTNRP